MNADSAAVPPPVPTPAPYGLLGSLSWTATGIVAWFLTQMALVVVYAIVKGAVGPDDLKKLATDGTILSIAVIAAAPVWIGVLVLAARLRGWSARDYLALITPKRAEILFGIAVLAPILVAFDLLTYAFGRDVVPPFMRESYVTAKMAGALPLFFLAVIVVAPLGEEIAFRGFLFRGLSSTWLGVAGTIIVTSAIWALMHVQYDWVEVAQIVLIGLLLGWLRWASGSTLLKILLHMLTNLGATLEAMIKVEWLS